MKTKLLLLFLLISTLTIAQEKKTIYYYTSSTAFIEGEGKKAIISDVKSTSCFTANSNRKKIAIENQLNNHLKAEYKNWHKYYNIVWYYYSKEEAEIKRRKYIANSKNENYQITKDIHFKFYCKN